MERCFIRIAKTGSTSVRQALGRDFGTKQAAHVRACSLLVRWGDRFTNAFIYSFVRDPWDRIVSLYVHRHRRQPVDRTVFSGWVMQAPLGEGGHGVSCWDMLNLDGQLDHMGFIGRFETLAEDYLRLKELLDGAGKPKLKRLNRGKRPREYRALYTDEAREKVAAVYAKDVDTWGYRFT